MCPHLPLLVSGTAVVTYVLPPLVCYTQLYSTLDFMIKGTYKSELTAQVFLSEGFSRRKNTDFYFIIYKHSIVSKGTGHKSSISDSILLWLGSLGRLFFTDNTFLEYKAKSYSLFFMCLGLFQLDLCLHALHLKFQLLDGVYQLLLLLQFRCSSQAFSFQYLAPDREEKKVDVFSHSLLMNFSQEAYRKKSICMVHFKGLF